MRGIKGLVTETSVLDAEEGIRLRGYTIPELQKLLPAAKSEPLPEGILYLLMTGEIPNEAQVKEISMDLVSRSSLPNHVLTMLDNFPKDLHPMAQFAAASAALNSESKFVEAYNTGVKRAQYWEVLFRFITIYLHFFHFLTFFYCLVHL